ncbi:hypothetical protein PSPTOT1_5538 [Pseudomonas syringae pv. tomato T1]|nr:hypothetical protein PSPTOT1_5538 [Pseudomonas syringae pv. tomato T1]
MVQQLFRLNMAIAIESSTFHVARVGRKPRLPAEVSYLKGPSLVWLKPESIVWFVPVHESTFCRTCSFLQCTEKINNT